MAQYVVALPQRVEIGRTELYNATTSDLAFGLAASQDLTAQTVLAYVYSTGAGENGFAYMFAKTPSASSSGPRLFIDTGTGAFTFAAHSTGTAGAPLRTSNTAAIPTSNIWTHIAGTWSGDLAGNTISLYLGITNAVLTEVSSYSATTNGTTAVSVGAGNNLHVGNREGTDRTFNGTIAYVARWNRVLSLAELRQAQQQGPLSVPLGLIFCWAGGRDVSPSRLNVITNTAVLRTGQPPINNRLGQLKPRLLQFNIPAVSTFNALLLAGD